MTSVIAHELRGPMGSIRSAAALLADGSYGQLPAEAKEIVLLIQNAADRLLNQTESYLEVMQIVNGTYRLQPHPLDVKTMVQKLTDEWRPQAKLKKIKLSCAYKNLPPKLLMDESVLSHIIYNLLDNAIKYTEKGEVNISASWNGEKLKVIVEDSGTGMSKKTIAELFKHPLMRTNNKDNLKKGLCLGLYIVSELLKAAKGQITAKSSGKNKGSTFIVQLPAEKFDA